MPCMSFTQAHTNCVQTHTHTHKDTHVHSEPLREIYMSAWHCSNPWCQSSSTWALLSVARRQSPIYQALLPPPHIHRDKEEGSGHADSRDHTWCTHWGNGVAVCSRGRWGRNDEQRQWGRKRERLMTKKERKKETARERNSGSERKWQDISCTDSGCHHVGK